MLKIPVVLSNKKLDKESVKPCEESIHVHYS